MKTYILNIGLRRSFQHGVERPFSAGQERGVRGIDVEGVNIDFTGFEGLHSNCLLNLKH